MHKGYMLDLIVYETRTDDSNDPSPNRDVDYDLRDAEPLSDQFVSKTDLAKRMRLLEIAILHYKIFSITTEDAIALDEMARGVREAIDDLMRGENV